MKLSTVDSNKKRIISLGAFALMFFVLWAFCAIELYADNKMIFIAESVFFFLIYALTLFNIPLIIPFVCLVAGCIADAFLNRSVMPERELSIFFPVTYFLAFLFYFEQLYRVRKGGDSLFANILAWIFRIVAATSAVADIVYIIVHGTIIGWSQIFRIFAFVLIGLIYYIISIVPTNTAPDYSKKKKKKKLSEKGYVTTRISFIFVIVASAASCLLFIFNWNDCYSYVVPILWAVNLVLLYENGHPLICASNKRFRERVNSWVNR